MNAALAINQIPIEDYLAMEAQADFKSEYYAGEIFSMAGGTINHNRIAGNACFSLKTVLKAKPFEVFIGDVKLHIPPDSFTYPDVLVIKGKPDYFQNSRDIVCNTQLIIEVLSDSTKDYDRAGKFEIYRTLPELFDYILISQDKLHIEHFEKQAPQQWLLTEYNTLSDTIYITQINETLLVADIYDKVDFKD